MPKNGGFSQSVHFNFLIFCTKPNLWSRKNDVFTFFGKIQKWPFSAKFGSFLLQISVIYCLWFLIKYIYFVLIFLTLCFKLYLDTLEHKSQFLPGVSSFFALFWLLGFPSTIHFSCLNLYFDHFSYLSLSISHFNLKYLDLCKFKLFDETLQCGLVIQLYCYI